MHIHERSKPSDSRHLTLSLCLLFTVVIATSGAAGRDKSDEKTPFTLTWIEGKCVDCKTASNLARIQVVSRNEAWAIGYQYAPQGAGDFIVVQTKDGGHTWRELPRTYQHAGDEYGPPAFSFLDANRGWIAWWNLASEPKIIRTGNGGRNWQDVPGEFLQKVIFFDDSRGYGTEVTKFLRTNDGGQHWTGSPIPDLRFIDRMFFLTPEIGWIAGTDGKDFFVFHTTNGGRDWEESKTTPPDELANVRDIFFLDQNRGWLITWHFNNSGTYLFSTEDGGKNWIPEHDLSFQGNDKWEGVVRFISKNIGFVFVRDSVDRLVYTLDGGTRWTQLSLPHSVYDCQVFEGDLLCSAGNGPAEFKLLTVHTKHSAADIRSSGKTH